MDALEVRVRAYDEADLEDVLEIHRQPNCIRQTLQLPHRPPEEIRAKMRSPRPGTRWLVAEVDEGEAPKVVGLLGLGQEAGRRAHVATIGMFVHDRYQRRGVGTRLLSEAIDLAERWLGITRIELQVYADNAAAIRLYEKLGFETEGTLRRHALRDGEYADSLTMARLHPRPKD